jgi:Uncharacterized protein conserved in bacteria
MDDYFYPYSENDAAGRKIPFPDSERYARYRSSGGTLARDDWRRENVNQLVREMYAAIKRAKPWVKFGVSPFGIWRPGYPERIKGFDAYSELFADSRKWLAEGWVDYFTPQIYWAIGKPDERIPCSFTGGRSRIRCTEISGSVTTPAASPANRMRGRPARSWTKSR